MKTGLEPAIRHTARSTGMDRRHEMRLAAPLELRLELPPSRTSLDVNDIGFGGLSFISPVPLTVGSPLTIRVILVARCVRHLARVAHCHTRGDGSWLVGVSFVDRSADGDAAIEDLLNAVLDSLISFSWEGGTPCNV